MTEYWTPPDDALSIREDIANALLTQLISTGVTVTPFQTRTASPPHITLEPDSPFLEPVGFQGRTSGGALIWAYIVKVTSQALDNESMYTWFEDIAPQIITACFQVDGAQFHHFEAPKLDQVGDRTYLVAEGHVTVKRQRSA